MRRTILLTALAATACFSAAAQNDGTMNSKKTLVAYFSATGTTERAARMIAAATGGDLYSIEPVEEYTSTDLDWTDKSSRSTVEMNDSNSRPAIKPGLKDADSYDVIYLGYPIWWNLAPRVINTFIETYGFSGKTVIPFATSGGSGISNSVKELKKAYPDIRWQEGRLLNAATEKSIENWIGR